MAIVWWEDFEALSAATLSWRADEITGAGHTVASAIGGMTGQCLALSGTAGRAVGFAFPTNYGEGVFSAAGRASSASFTQANLFTLSTGATINIAIRINADGSISALRNTTVLGSSAAGVIPGNKRFRIEVGFVISATVGEVVVKIDQGSGAATVLNLTGQNTANSGTTINRVRFESNNLNVLYWDDLWFETDKTAFRNDLTFVRLAPSADVSGVSTTSTGVNRFATIDETPGSTTDYNTFAVTGEDVFECADLSTTPDEIAGVGIYYVASKQDAGTLEFRARLRSGSDNFNGTTSGLNATVLGYSDFTATDPQGGGAWTKARVDAVRLVHERIS